MTRSTPIHTQEIILQRKDHDLVSRLKTVVVAAILSCLVSALFPMPSRCEGSNWQVASRAASLAYQEKNFDTAIDLYRRAIDLCPSKKRPLYKGELLVNLSRVYLDNHSFAETEKTLLVANQYIYGNKLQGELVGYRLERVWRDYCRFLSKHGLARRHAEETYKKSSLLLGVGSNENLEDAIVLLECMASAYEYEPAIKFAEQLESKNYRLNSDQTILLRCFHGFLSCRLGDQKNGIRLLKAALEKARDVGDSEKRLKVSSYLVQQNDRESLSVAVNELKELEKVWNDHKVTELLDTAQARLAKFKRP